MTKLLLIAFLLCAFSISAQQTSSLTGSVIGVPLSEAPKAFDNNSDTYTRTSDNEYTWCGLDLGTPHVITRIGYIARTIGGQQGDVDYYRARLRLGVFQGASTPDFSDAISLAIVAVPPVSNEYTYIELKCSKGFRYVRFVSPHGGGGNVAELTFEGYKGEGDYSQLPQLTNLPTVTVSMADNKEIVIKEEYLPGIITVVWNEGTKYHQAETEMRGRGNASWNFPKKPYRIKLGKKASLVNHPATEKNWTLIPNYGDKTLMRNLLANEVSRISELHYTPAACPVDLVFNGDYRGTYNLSDHLEVKPFRVDVTPLKESDTTDPNITGGYHVEIDAYAYQEPVGGWFQSYRGTPVTIKSDIFPEGDVNGLQYRYIKDHFQKLENALYSPVYQDPSDGYRRYLDLDSFLKHFLVGEFSGNTDTYWSVHMSKERNNDRFQVGPVWDFDIAFENDKRTFPINGNNKWVYEYGSEATGMRNFINRILTDPTAMVRMKEIWGRMRNKNGLTAERMRLMTYQYAEKLEASQKLNFTRWDIMQTFVHENPRVWGSYAAEVENVVEYMKARIAWMDKKLDFTYTGVDENIAAVAHVYGQRGRLVIEKLTALAEVKVYHVEGRLVTMFNTSESTTRSLPAGIYIVTLQCNQAVQKYKVVVP